MEAVQAHEAVFQHSPSGRALFYRLWQSEKPKGLVVIVHGFGEHGGRYEPLAHALAEAGLTVACPDLWGHGRTAGRRGDIDRFDRYLDDLEILTSQVFIAQTGQPRFGVFGHSFGGLVAIHWALRQPSSLRCLILQSPLLGVGFPLPQWKERLAGALRRVWPRLSLPIGLDPAWLSHDPAIAQRYQQDPLVHNRISLRCYQTLQVMMPQALERARGIITPTLVLYGSDDRVVSVKACQECFEKLACEKRLVGFPGCYHELHHESVMPSVVEEVLQWVQAHA